MSSTLSPWKLAGSVAVAVMAVGCATTSGSEAGGAMAAPAVTPEMIAQGQVVYSGSGNCQTCHGPEGMNGRFGPPLADDTWLWVDPTDPNLVGEVAALVRAGIPEPRGGNTPMPAMGGGNLSEDQIMAVAAYVVSLSQ